MKLFIIGSVKPVDSVFIENVYVDKNQVEISGDFISSADAFRKYKYRIEDGDLYVTIYWVYVSDFYRYGKVDIKIEGEFSNLDNIYLEDQTTKKLIWKKQE